MRPPPLIPIAHLDMFTKQQNCQLFGQIKISQDIVHKPRKSGAICNIERKPKRGGK